jgi:uncharacterized membrane protein
MLMVEMEKERVHLMQQVQQLQTRVEVALAAAEEKSKFDKASPVRTTSERSARMVNTGQHGRKGGLGALMLSGGAGAVMGAVVVAAVRSTTGIHLKNGGHPAKLIV